MARFPSTAQVNVDPGVVLVNLILAWRRVDCFLGALVTVVSGAGQAAWVRFDCGHRSWETSPKRVAVHVRLEDCGDVRPVSRPDGP